jgi:hypothetical protein
MAGFLTSKQIWGCTTFIDHINNYIYVHLMKNFTILRRSSIGGKQGWEKVELWSFS